MTADVVLSAGSTVVTVAVDAGGRIAQIDAGGQPLLIPPGDDPASTGWGSFPMAPWAGRIRHGRFRFLGVDHHLDVNHQDGDGGERERRHAIHGTVFARPWTVDARSEDTIDLSCPLTGALGWRFDGTARQHIRVGASEVVCELEVEAGDEPVPVELGWHPWFRKPDELDFRPMAMYVRDDIGLPTGELVSPPPGPWDDCFLAAGPVTLRYDREDVSAVTVDSDCDHWVVYDMPEEATCVEPQSGPPDAIAVRPRILAPGDSMRRTMSIGW